MITAKEPRGGGGHRGLRRADLVRLIQMPGSLGLPVSRGAYLHLRRGYFELS